MEVSMKKFLPHAAAVVLMVIWGLSYLSIRFVVNEIDPVLSAFYRFAISTAVMSLFAFGRGKRVHREDRLRFVLGGLFGVATYFTFQNIGVKLTTTANVAIIVSTIPVVTLLVNSVVLKIRLDRWKAAGVVMSVLGIALIVLAKENFSLFSSGTLGDLLVLGAALSWVAYTLLMSNLKGSYSPMEASFHTNAWGTLFLSPILLKTGLQPLSPTGIFHLLYLSIVCTFVGYNLYLYCLKALGSVKATAYINLEPAISVAVSIFILKEAVFPLQIAGAAVIILGVFLVNRKG